jgi:polysaccharide export outer membrane protein
MRAGMNPAPTCSVGVERGRAIGHLIPVERWFRFVLGVVLSLLAGCGPPAKPVKLPVSGSANTLDAGDEFLLFIQGEDKLPTEYKVAPDGTVDVPFIHRIKVAGLEPQQISDLIKKRLADEKYFDDPNVIVNIKALHSKRITVAGEVKEERNFPYENGMTLVDAIAQAGGMTSLSKSGSVILLRKTKRGTRRVLVDYDAITNNDIPDVPLQPGDKITVPQRPF